MRSRTFLLSLLLLTLVSPSLFAQKKKRPKQPKQPKLEQTTLWEVSGNGMERPSYLFGTIHTSDARVFDLPDSVLPKLDACPIFASELMLDSTTRAAMILIAMPDEPDISEEASGIAFSSDDDAPVISGDSSLPAVEVSPARLRRRRLQILSAPMFRHFVGTAMSIREGEKPTMLDAHLYNIAKRQGKELVGLETIEEQFGAAESFTMDDLVEMMNRGSEYASVDPEEEMLRFYLKGDLSQVLTMVQNIFAGDAFRKLITERNYQMVERGTALMKRSPVFMAVGTGHLPGKEGMIELFRKEGYTVRPVAQTRTGDAADYEAPTRELPWHTFISDTGAFMVDMPDLPVTMPLNRFGAQSYDEANSSYAWPDIGAGILYMVRYFDFSAIPEDQIEIFIRGIAESGFGIPSASTELPLLEKIDTGKNREWNVETIEENGKSGRGRIFIRGNRLYGAVAISTGDVIRSSDVDRFLNSFRLREYMPSEWKPYTSAELGCAVSMPAQGEILLHENDDQSAYLLGSIDARDRATGEFFALDCVTYGDYFEATNEEEYLQSISQNAISENDTILSIIPITHKGSPGREILVGQNGDTLPTLRTRLYLRGNRLYRLEARIPHERITSSDVQGFFNSFDFIGDSVPVNIFTNKFDRLISDLTSDNSTTRVKARAAVAAYPFTEKHLPILYDRIGRTMWSESAEDEEIRSLLITRLPMADDSSTIPFLRAVYPTVAHSPYFRYAVQTALFDIGTDSSFALLVDLLLQDVDSDWEVRNDQEKFTALSHFQYENKLLDPFLPRLLPLLRVEEHRDMMQWLLLDAVDRGVIAGDDFAEYQGELVTRLGEAIDREIDPYDDSGIAMQRNYDISSLVGLLGRLPLDAEAIGMITPLLDNSDTEIRLAAVVALLRQGERVPVAPIRGFAREDATRARLYRELMLAGRLDQFPIDFRTQALIAQSALVARMIQEEAGEVNSIELVEEREGEFMGKRGRFYLFKFQIDYDDTWQVGINGPQPPEQENIDPDYGRAWSNFDPFDSKTIDEHFESLLHVEQEAIDD